MEVKSVPWWRKALDFALSGIRSGFGLFSREQKQNNEIAPEPASGHEEIREEEAALTEHFPEQDPVVELESKIQANVEAANASNTEVLAEPEVTTRNAREAGPQQGAELNPEEELVPEPEVEMHQEEERVQEPEFGLQTEEVQVPEHEGEVQSEEVQLQAPEAELQTEVVPASEPEIEVQPGEELGELAQEPEVELHQEEERVREPEFGSQTEEERFEEPEAATRTEEESAPERELLSEVAIEVENIKETVAEPEAETVIEDEFPIANQKDRVPEEEPVTEVASETREMPESFQAIAESNPEARDPSAEPDPETTEQDTGVEPIIEASSEQVTERQETLENAVDELTQETEAAISEESEPESASPVPDETAEPVQQATGEAVPESVEEVAELVAGQAAEQIDERTTDQNIEIGQAVAQPMELNHPNSEPAAEQEQTAGTPAPIAASAEPVAPPAASAEIPAAVDEPEAPTTVTSAPQHPSKPFIKLEAREGEANASPFSVIVSQVYDGPLDLLLDLIRKQDIDIYDIPIARITAQFLAYVDQLKSTDVDVAGEFIYTASLLIHIKSKMLLPRAPSGPDDAAEDPRRELVERLLEHERFKNAAQMLQQKQVLEAATWTNPGIREFKEDSGTEPEIAADTTDLVRVFQNILERIRNRPVLNVQEDAVTVGQMIQFLSRRLTMEDKPIALQRLLSHTRSERALIAMFLALLELVRLQAILLRQDRAFSEIFIKKHSNFENVMTETTTHDDWK